jgi:hypothetical protein
VSRGLDEITLQKIKALKSEARRLFLEEFSYIVDIAVGLLALAPVQRSFLAVTFNEGFTVYQRS